ncbi:MAG: hypothetical protein WCL06_11885 [Bacteroidota bacterium]
MDPTEKKKKKENLMINLLCIAAPLLVVGIWMLIAPGPPEHQEIEKGSVYFLKEIWGEPAGITLIILSLIVAVLSIMSFRRVSKPKPKTLSYQIFSLSFAILIITAVVYGIVLLQSFLGSSGIIPSRFAYSNLSEIHLGCITFLLVFGIIAVISWLFARPRKNK